MFVLLLFFCSGATALVYEVLWSKYLSLMLGSTMQAQTVVLAVFMGGLAIGNRLFGRHSLTVKEPLKSYGYLELFIGGYAFLFPRIFRLGDYVFVQAGSAVVDLPVLPLMLKFFLSVMLLLLPTILMGGTLPLISVWLQRQSGLEPGARVGIFYAVNSLGAVLGAGLAGFYLVQNFGLVSSLELTALANLLVGLMAVIWAKRESLELRPAPAAFSPALAPSREPAASGAWFGLLVAVTGGVSMGLEVLSARALALIAGGSLQSFALVLMSFILGIGLGSVVISSSRGAREYGVKTIYVLLISAASLVLAHVLLIERWALFYTQGRYGLASNESGYFIHQLAVGLLSFGFLGLPAAFLGAVVPLSIRFLSVPGSSLGDQVGRLLTYNTLGAVAGVLTTGFILMPFLGLRVALAALALVLIGAAGLIAFQREHSSMLLFSVLLGASSVAALASTGEKWQHVMSAGIFRVRTFLLSEQEFKDRKARVELVYYKDSADATVSVESAISTNEIRQLTLRINGKSDASTLGDLSTQYLLAHLPMAMRPDARNVFVLGFGSGITAGALLGHPIEKLTIAENCGPVLEAAPLFNDWNRGVLTNERTRILKDDARSVLKLRPDEYDIIISEPSNPWVVGVGSVFSQDFYELCAARLSTNGIMAQWFHRYEMSDSIVFLIFRTFASVFPHMEIWDTQEGDLVLLGSKSPWPSTPAHYQAIFNRSQPQKDMVEVGIPNGLLLWTRQVASQKTALSIPGDGPVQTDEFPILEYAAPKAFFIGQSAIRMYYFDERTIQFPLVEQEKLTAMRQIPNNALSQTFRLFPPSNPDIRLYLQATNSRTNAIRLDPLGHIIFRPPNSYPEHPPLPTNAPPELLTFIKAEATLLRGEVEWKKPVNEIEQTLLAMMTANQLNPRGYKAEYFAALAVRFAIGHGDYETALRLLRIGFVFAVNDEQLSYLSRVMDRVVPPDFLQRAKAADQIPKL